MAFLNLQRISCCVPILLFSLLAISPSTMVYANGSAATTLPSVESFFEYPVMSSVALSPDGRNVAMLVADKEGKLRLGVMDVVERKPKVLASLDDADVSQFHWVNSDRLVFSAGDHTIGQGNQQDRPGLYAIDRDGKNFRQLVDRNASMLSNRNSIVSGILPFNTIFYTSDAKKDSDDIYVLQLGTRTSLENDNHRKPENLLRLNTRTGHATTIERPGFTTGWVMDQQGEPRVATTEDGDIASVFYKDPSDEKWRKLVSFNIFGHGFTPEFIGPDGVLYVRSRYGSDKVSLFRYDLGKNAIDPTPVVSLKGYDYAGAVVYNDKKFLGVHYETDADDTLWFDKDMQAMQQQVNALLPGTVNRINVARRSETPYVLVTSFSDVQPYTFFLYDSAAQKLTLLGRTMPQIDPQQMASKDMVHYKARDGLDIPAYLTLPNVAKGKDKKNLPMVVLVHGGPWVRGGDWRWSREVQFLASRGYAVLEPEYRGSTGFGWKHFHAGWKQWGLAMQDDVADGTKWAIAQGIADPKRVCIAGASYGGYATLMGLINDPKLYKCGFEWVGVTDINLMYNVTWSDASDESKKYGTPVLVGDQVKDAVQLKATSPLENAAKITQPLLMAYGGSDVRVPEVHGNKFLDAVKVNNPNVEWITYPEEGHGWRLIKNNVDFWTRVEKFLDKNIGAQ